MEGKRRAGYELLKLAAQKIPYLALHGQTSAPHGADIRYCPYSASVIENEVAAIGAIAELTLWNDV